MKALVYHNLQDKKIEFIDIEVLCKFNYDKLINIS